MDNVCREGDDEEDDDEETGEQFSFPELDAQIRQAITDYGAVFPKLNFTSPKVRIHDIKKSTSDRFSFSTSLH